MSEHIRDRINRRLDGLAEERLYQILDYVEFLESKYAQRANPPANAFQKFAESVEDKMRAGRVSASTIADTMGLLNKAVGMLNNVAAAGKTVATDLANAAQRVGTAVSEATAQASTATGGTTPATPDGPSSPPPADAPSPKPDDAGGATSGPPGTPTTP